MKSRTLTLLLAPIWGGALAAEPDGQEALNSVGRDTSLTGGKAVEHLERAGQYDSLTAAINSARYGAKTSTTRESVATAASPAHGLFCTFTPDGLHLEIPVGDSVDAAVHGMTWRLASLGSGAKQIPVQPGQLEVSGQRVELIRSASSNPQSATRNLKLIEWFHNSATGLEHGFTLSEPPGKNVANEPLRLVIAVSGDLVRADAVEQSVTLCDAAGRGVLSYDKLKVWDATGAELPATMQVTAGSVTLSVNEATARYPLTIDPILGQQAYLKENSINLGDFFGSAVAISSNTVVVGVPLGGDGTTHTVGTVCVFVRDGTTWTQQALKAGDPGAFDGFGTSVAVSGDTIVIGASNEDSSATGINGDQFNNNLAESGAAYVFVRNGTNWTPQAYLKASNAGRDDYFGLSVAVSGDTIVVGAPLEDSIATGINGNQANDSLGSSGAAYVFVRTGTNWSQQAYLKASNTGAGDQFGHSLAVSGDTVVVGAPGESSSATGVNGNQNDDNADNSGAAYVFVRNGTIWAQQSYFKAGNTEANDFFGSSVAVSGDTVVVGAPFEDSSATGVNGNQSDNSAFDSGAAYIFVRDPVNFGSWQTAYLKASNPEAQDNFGWSVAVSDGRVLVGAPFEDSNATRANGSQSDNNAPDSGALYLFVRGGTIFSPTWRFRDYLKASNTGAGDQFGTAAAISGDVAAVGAPYEDSNAVGVNGDQSNNTATNAGAAYVFGPPMPDIVVEQLGANIPDGGTSPQFVVAGLGTTSFTFTIKNAGDVDLTGLTTTIDGAAAAMFAVTASPVAPVAPASNTTFTVRFAPGTIGTSTAMLHFANNDPDESPFDIVLRGLALSFSQDTDGDGLNDASELQLSALGFDWQVSQPALVSVLFNNANDAGLFTKSQLQALNVNTPLLAKDPATGLFKLTIGVEKATQLANFVAFPMTAPQTTINAGGKLEFRFASPDNAAFYRLEAR